MRRLWIIGAFAAALLALVVPYATAVHDEELFELDANAFDEAATGDDWDTLVGGGGSANVFNMTQDPVESPADDIFDGGQSKDTSDIDAWSWKGAEPNDKNDIQHAFAAAYEDPDNGHLIVYFGLDRLDSSGDAAAGFWFLKRPVEQVTINGKNVFVYKGTNTLAEHSVGDVLVQSDFTNGGVVERIDSYGWGVAPAGSQVQPGSPLRLIAEGADCDDDAEPPELCGQVNDGGEDVPANWPGSVNPAGSVKFKGPGGVSNSTVFNDATFLEGGIDLTSLFGRNVCTAQFIAETRQSQSETAVLEDKVEGDFELCDIEVTKSGPEKSKVGDDATYEVEVKNTGAVTLFKQSIEDTLAGDLTDGTNPAIVDSTCGESLAPDETCTIEYTYTVQAGDPDPLPNTVDIEYNRDEELTGDSVTDSASHEVNLFQPSITFEKTGDAVSKIGDTVDYTLTLNNTSSDDSPDLECTISDPTVGVDEDVTLASGASEVIEVTDFEIPAGADDPFPNTATATCSPQGFPNVLEASDGHEVNLFQPSITFEKTGDADSKIGDTVDYTLTLNNTSSDDSPDLECTISDPTVGVDEDVTLASGASEVIEVTDFEIPAGADDPFPNTATATCSPQGFPNVLEASDGHEVNLFQPSITFEKTGDADSKIGDTVDYTLTLNNTSSDDSPDLECTISDPTVGVDEDVTLASGASEVIEVTDFEIPAGADDPFPNTATATCSPQGFPNVLEASDGHEVNLFQPSITFEKTGDADSKIGDTVDYTLTLNNTSSDDSPDLECTISDPTVGVDEDVTLASGASEVIEVTDFEIPAGADDPFPNTATATCSPQGFPNVLEASDGHEVNLFQPSITFEKTGDADSKIGDTVDYTLTLNNTSSDDSPDLECTISDPTVGVDEDVTLASGASEVIEVTDFEIPAGADDPFPNTATATCSPQGFPNVLEASDGHEVNLFQPSITFEKTGDADSKIGDTVDYTLTLNNTSSDDSPDLECTISDPTVGVDEDVTLASGASEVIEVTDFEIPAGADDPFPNTATATCSPQGFPNVLEASDGHEVNLFQPSITFEKTGDADSKIGDTVDYTLTLNNTSSDDSPDLECTISDPTVGVDEDVTLASGASEVIEVTDFEIPAGADDPFPNTATATCSPQGFPNVLEASDGHEVNLFQPSITVEKQAGNPFSKAGDDVTYTVKINNTSSADSPDLVIESIDDSLQGDLTDPGNVDSSDCGPSLASATSCTIEYTRTVVAGDPEILTNTVSVKTHPDGFANDIDASDAVDVDILHPSYTVAKDCKSGTEPVPQQGPAVFTVTFTNTGDADLVITADDGIGQVSLAAGATMSFTVTINGPFSGQSTVENTVTTSAVLGAQYGLPNTLQGNATGDCRVGSRVKVKKLTSGVVNPSQNWTFQLFNAGPHGDDSDSSFLGSPLATATTLGDGDGVLDFGNINLDPTKTYTLCERDVPSGWTVIWKVDTNGDGTPDTTVSPFNPNSKDVPPADLGNRCFDFGAGTGYPLPAGGTLAFEINNTRPGGQPRTIGYWKNWSSCTGGNQVRTAAKNGGVAAGFFLLDNVLPITIGSYTIPAANTVESGTNKTGCQIAVLLLGKSDKKTGKNMANDAAYGLAAQLIAAKANLKAGAVNCPALTTAIASADSLLTSINFTGTGEYLGPKVKGALATTRTQALSLAATLDQYNNGNLC